MRSDNEFDQIVHTYVNDIRKIVYSYVRNHHTMEDITQEVFLAVFYHMNSFRGDSSIKTWIYKIAINKSKDYLKSWQYRKLQLSNWLIDAQETNDMEKTVLDSLQNKELGELILKLPIKYREIIILYYYQEMDTNEIATVLNLNVSTVKTRLIRSRELLKRRFDFSGRFSN